MKLPTTMRHQKDVICMFFSPPYAQKPSMWRVMPEKHNLKGCMVVNLLVARKQRRKEAHWAWKCDRANHFWWNLIALHLRGQTLELLTRRLLSNLASRKTGGLPISTSHLTLLKWMRYTKSLYVMSIFLAPSLFSAVFFFRHKYTIQSLWLYTHITQGTYKSNTGRLANNS